MARTGVRKEILSIQNGGRTWLSLGIFIVLDLTPNASWNRSSHPRITSRHGKSLGVLVGVKMGLLRSCPRLSWVIIARMLGQRWPNIIRNAMRSLWRSIQPETGNRLSFVLIKLNCMREVTTRLRIYIDAVCFESLDDSIWIFHLWYKWQVAFYNSIVSWNPVLLHWFERISSGKFGSRMYDPQPHFISSLRLDLFNFYYEATSLL